MFRLLNDLEWMKINRTSFILYLLITLLVIALFLDGNPTFDRIELAFQDSMFRFRGARTSAGQVVVCALDDATIDRIGWPMARDSLARLITGLREAGAAAIVCDFDWRSVDPEGDVRGDSLFLQALEGEDRVILPIHFTYADLGVAVPAAPESYRHAAWTERFPPGSAVSAQALFGPEPHLADSATAVAGVTPLLDPDRVVRHAPLLIDYGGVPFASNVLWATTLFAKQGRTSWWLEPGEQIKVAGYVVPVDDRGRLMLNYYGPAHTLPYHSATEFLGDPSAAPGVRGKVVVVGPTGYAGRLSLSTRVSDDIPAPEVTATAIANILQHDFVLTPGYSALFDLLLLVLIGVFCGVVLPKVTLMYRFLILGISLFVIVNIQYLLFASFGWLLHAFYPAMELVFFMAVSPLLKGEGDDTAEERARTRPSPKPGRVIDRSGSMAVSPGDKGTGAIPTQAVPSGPYGDTVATHQETAVTGLSDGSRTIHVPSARADAEAGQDPTEFVDRQDGLTPPTAMIETDGHPTPDGMEMPDPAHMGPSDQGSGPPPAPHSPEPPVAQQAPEPERPAPAIRHGVETPPPRNDFTDGPGIVKGATVTDSGQYLGRYRLLEEIGRGAMGIVYKGIDPAINRPVALKTVRLDLAAPADEKEELRNRLLREAQAAGQLSHPNIVTIYDIGSQGDVHYIAMEYLKGYTLERAVQKKMSLNYKIFAKLMIQVCDALEYAHTNELVHRDVKPANIMVLDNFKVKVMDFGIARVAHSNMTQTGVALGTPSYISPEQLSGQGVDRRSDIYSLGVVMYELLTKEKPFSGDSINKLIFNILNEKPRRPTEFDEGIPQAFNAICAKALAKNPGERYQYAADLGRDLKEFIASLAPQRLRI